jgi:inner membrane protein
MSPAQIWFLVGLVLVLGEFVTPGVILVFIGLGAWLASLTTWLGWTESLGMQMMVFAISSLVLLVGLRRLFKSWLMGFSKTNPDASRDLDEFIGKPVRVMSAFEAGVPGKVEFKGANWTAESDEPMQPGDTAIITSMDGLCLKVKRK